MESTSSLLALITRVPTSPSRSSADSMLISSSCWSASTSTAGPTASRASPIVSFSALSVPARLLSDSSAWMMSVFCWSSVPTTPSSEPSIDRSRSSRPDITRFASRVIVPSWATPPPLSRNDSAPSTSSTSGLRPVAARAMVSPFPRRPSDSSSGGCLQGDVLLPQQRDLADLGDRVVRQHDVVLHPHRDPGVPADPVDLGDLADDDVVDHHRGPRHHVEHVGEVGGHLEGVVLVDRRAGQRQVVGAVEVAAAQQHRARGHRRQPAGHPPHDTPPRSSVIDGSASVL